MFKEFTGCEYLMIDAAEQFGIKGTFETRINWTTTNFSILESLLPQAKSKTKPLYLKAVNAISDTQKGIAIGHMVGLDSSSSGIQIMSAVLGCKTGARNTGLVDPDTFPDAYTTCTDVIKRILGYAIDVERDDAKQALMTFMYGSEKIPKEIFEEGSPAYQAFFLAAKEVAPEAYDLRNILIGAWQSHTLKHSWVMPDGFDVQIKVMQTEDIVVKVPELNSSFTHRYLINEGSKKGLSLAANTIHAIDGMIVREMCRRCNYDLDIVINASDLLYQELVKRNIHHFVVDKTNFISLNKIDDLQNTIHTLSDNEVVRLNTLVLQILVQSKPFELLCIHDAFHAHPNNLNTVRYWYKEILAELADSHIMQNILQQIYKGTSITLNRASEDLGDLIRNSNYGIA